MTITARDEPADNEEKKMKIKELNPRQIQITLTREEAECLRDGLGATSASGLMKQGIKEGRACHVSATNYRLYDQLDELIKGIDNNELINLVASVTGETPAEVEARLNKEAEAGRINYGPNYKPNWDPKEVNRYADRGGCL